MSLKGIRSDPTSLFTDFFAMASRYYSSHPQFFPQDYKINTTFTTLSYLKELTIKITDLMSVQILVLSVINNCSCWGL